MGPCNSISRHRGLPSEHTSCIFRWPMNVDSKCQSKTFINITRPYGVLNKATLWILTTVSFSNPVLRILRTAEVWVDMSWENNYKNCSRFFTDTVFNTTLFFHQSFTHFSYFASQRNWGTRSKICTCYKRYHCNYIFYVQDHIRRNSKFY
jgi:hypothetical protein